MAAAEPGISEDATIASNSRNDRTPAVELAGLKKGFRRADGAVVRAIDDVDLSVDPGEFIVLLGPSGCGKTTLLRTIAGLETPDEGRIDIAGRTRFSSADGISEPPERRGISMIFQSYALWPHMTVFKNVAYPLRSRSRMPRSEVASRVERALEQVGIGELAGQHPGQLSGGQQQRVALARALVSRDGLVLFDEPLSNVDAKVREQLRAELVQMQRELGFTAIFVTHDQTEAMELATRVAVVDRGKVAQFAPPHEIYHRPRSRYVAGFIGAINEFEGRVVSVDREAIAVDTPAGRIVSARTDADVAVGDDVVAIWRPERGHVGAEARGRANRWTCAADSAAFVGAHTEFGLRIGEQRVRVWSPRNEGIRPGDDVEVGVDAADVQVLPAKDSTGVQAEDAP